MVDKNAYNAFLFQRKEINAQKTVDDAAAEAQIAATNELQYKTTYQFEAWSLQDFLLNCGYGQTI